MKDYFHPVQDVFQRSFLEWVKYKTAYLQKEHWDGNPTVIGLVDRYIHQQEANVVPIELRPQGFKVNSLLAPEPPEIEKGNEEVDKKTPVAEELQNKKQKRHLLICENNHMSDKVGLLVSFKEEESNASTHFKKVTLGVIHDIIPETDKKAGDSKEKKPEKIREVKQDSEEVVMNNRGDVKYRCTLKSDGPQPSKATAMNNQGTLGQSKPAAEVVDLVCERVYYRTGDIYCGPLSSSNEHQLFQGNSSTPDCTLEKILKFLDKYCPVPQSKLQNEDLHSSSSNMNDQNISTGTANNRNQEAETPVQRKWREYASLANQTEFIRDLYDMKVGYMQYMNGRRYCGSFLDGKFSLEGALETPGFLTKPAVRKTGKWEKGFIVNTEKNLTN